MVTHPPIGIKLRGFVILLRPPAVQNDRLLLNLEVSKDTFDPEIRV
jgi:hypothetical protein